MKEGRKEDEVRRRKGDERSKEDVGRKMKEG